MPSAISHREKRMHPIIFGWLSVKTKTLPTKTGKKGAAGQPG